MNNRILSTGVEPVHLKIVDFESTASTTSAMRAQDKFTKKLYEVQEFVHGLHGDEFQYAKF